MSSIAQVIDPVEDYLHLLKHIYDFGTLKAFLHRPDFKFVFDGMHGVAGPYAQRVFVKVCLPGCGHAQEAVATGAKASPASSASMHAPHLLVSGGYAGLRRLCYFDEVVSATADDKAPSIA